MKNYDIHSAILAVSFDLYEIHRIFSRMILVYNNENHRIDLELWKEIMDMYVNLEKNMEKLTDFFPIPEYDPVVILEYSDKEIPEMLTEAVDISREFLDDTLAAADIFAEYSTFLGFYKNIPNNFDSLRRIVRAIEDYMSKRVC